MTSTGLIFSSMTAFCDTLLHAMMYFMVARIYAYACRALLPPNPELVVKRRELAERHQQHPPLYRGQKFENELELKDLWWIARAFVLVLHFPFTLEQVFNMKRASIFAHVIVMVHIVSVMLGLAVTKKVLEFLRGWNTGTGQGIAETLMRYYRVAHVAFEGGRHELLRTTPPAPVSERAPQDDNISSSTEKSGPGNNSTIRTVADDISDEFLRRLGRDPPTASAAPPPRSRSTTATSSTAASRAHAQTPGFHAAACQSSSREPRAEVASPSESVQSWNDSESSFNRRL